MIVASVENLFHTYYLTVGMLICGSNPGKALMNFAYSSSGKIHLIRGNPRANADADVIFKQYQEQAASEKLPFQRFPLRAVRPFMTYPSRTLTHYMSSINVDFLFVHSYLSDLCSQVEARCSQITFPKTASVLFRLYA